MPSRIAALAALGATALAAVIAGAVLAQQDEPGPPETAPTAPATPGPPAEPTGEALSAAEVQKLFEGNTEVATALKRGTPTGREYKAYHEPNGQYRLKEKDGTGYGGAWFVDPLGRHCFRPGGKEKTKCDVIVREGDHYIRLREGERRGQFTIEQGNPYKL
jgi:hypothetical protein